MLGACLPSNCSYPLLARFFSTLCGRPAFFYVKQYLWLVGIMVVEGGLKEGCSQEGLTMLGACLPSNCPAKPCYALLAPHHRIPLYLPQFLKNTPSHTSLQFSSKEQLPAFLTANHTLLTPPRGPAPHTSIVRRVRWRGGSPNLEFTDLKGALKPSWKSGPTQLSDVRTTIPPPAISI